MNSKIKEARLNAQLTQAGMGRLLSIPVRTIQDWESMRRTCPKYVENMIIEQLHGFKLSHDYALLMAELQEDMAAGVLTQSSKIKIVRKDFDNFTYRPIVDWYYINNTPEEAWEESTVKAALNEMELYSKII